jgi:DNA-binding protein Fis
MTGEDVPLASSVERALRRYFKQLDGAPACDLYQLLGLNRGTLRKKLKTHGLL